MPSAEDNHVNIEPTTHDLVQTHRSLNPSISSSTSAKPKNAGTKLNTELVIQRNYITDNASVNLSTSVDLSNVETLLNKNNTLPHNESTNSLEKSSTLTTDITNMIP